MGKWIVLLGWTIALGCAGAAADGEDGAGTMTDAGASGAGNQAECATGCYPCNAGYEMVDCDSCLCERPADEVDDLKRAYSDALACKGDAPCPTSHYGAFPTPNWNGGECLLSALRDRTPGSYEYTMSLGDAGGTTNYFQLLVHGDDSVTIAGRGDYQLGNLQRDYFPTQRCQLRSYEFFEDCLTIGTDINPTTTGEGPTTETVCEMPSEWYTECEPAAPVCPGE